MNELEKQKLHELQELQQEEDRQMMRMYVEDKAALEQYGKSGAAGFHYAKTRSLARNYRDHDISVAVKQADPASIYAEAEKHLSERAAQIGGADSTLRMKDVNLPEGEKPLDSVQCLRNLCRCRLLKDELRPEDLQKLTDYLTAGMGDPAGETNYLEMHRQGFTALQEIYTRILDKLNIKYGESISKLSSYDYIRRLPDIEEDFSCLEDMQTFFTRYCPGSGEGDDALLRSRLQYYTDSFAVIKQRSDALASLDENQLTETGELTKSAEKDYAARLAKCRKTAKSKNAFRVRAAEKNLSLTLNASDWMKDKAQGKLGALSEITDRVRDGSGAAYGDDSELSDDNAEEQLATLKKQEKLLRKFLSVTSDKEFLSNADALIKGISTVIKLRHQFDASEEDLSSDSYNSYQKYIEHSDSQLHTDGLKVLKARLEEIGKYGYSITRYPLAKQAKADAPAQPPREAAPIQRNQAQPAANDFDEGVFRRETAEQTLRQLKQLAADYARNPDAYRTDGSYADYLKREKLRTLLPAYEKACILSLKKLDGVSPAAEIEQQRQAAVAEYKTRLQKLSGEETEKLAAGPTGELTQSMNTLTVKRDQILNNENVKAYHGLFADERNLARLVYVDTTDPGTMAGDLEALSRALDYKPGSEMKAEDVRAAVQLLNRFAKARDEGLDALRNGPAPFGDTAFVAARAKLEKCVLMIRVLDSAYGSEKSSAALFDALRQRSENLPIATFWSDFQKNARQLRQLYSYASGVSLEYAASQNVTNCTHFSAKGEIVESRTAVELRDTAAVLKTNGQAAASALKRQSGPQPLADSQLCTQVLQETRREFAASQQMEDLEEDERKSVVSKRSTLHTIWGPILKMCSWMFYEKRTEHGAMRYEECKKLYNKYLAGRPEAKDATLRNWQRGDAGTPPIELEKIGGSSLKKKLLSIVSSPAVTAQLLEDEPDEDYQGAIEAMRMYCGTAGIVTTESTEMEMAFLDKYRQLSAHFREMHPADQDADIAEQTKLLDWIDQSLRENLNGTLADSLTKTELDLIDARTTAYVEDSTIGANMQQSNIKDIPLFLHEPCINDVRQDTVGDCWLQAAIGTVVKTSPDFIRGMFHDLGNGDVLVRLYEASDMEGNISLNRYNEQEESPRLSPVYFKLRKQYETGSGNASDCAWVQLIEKAYALSGFNTLGHVELRGNQLVNSVKELTGGDPNVALAHLTGKWMEKITPPDNLIMTGFIQEKQYGNLFKGIGNGAGELERLITQKLTGDPAPAGSLQAALAILASLKKGKRAGKPDDIIARKAVAEHLGISPDKLDVEQYDRTLGEFQEQMKKNWNNMKEGRSLGGEDDIDIKEIQARQEYAQYYESSRPADYSPAEFLLFRRCTDAINKGGAVTVSDLHCKTIVDTREVKGKIFLLVRDPFNMENTVYNKDADGKVVSVNTGIASVIFLQGRSRHLSRFGKLPEAGSTGENPFNDCAFGGCSWIDLHDFYSKGAKYFAVNPSDVQA